MSEATKYLLSQGILGVVALVLGWWILRKDKEHVVEIAALRAACDVEKKTLLDAFVSEKNERIGDAKGYAGMSLQLQRDVLSYVSEAKTQDAKIVETIGVLASKVGEQSKAVDELTSWTIDKRARGGGS